MIINYFDKFNIDTNDINEKLNIISKSDTENAKYMSYILNNALEYLFETEELSIDKLKKDYLKENDDVVIFFDTISNDVSTEVMEISQKTNLIIVGKHENRKINDKIECVKIEDFRAIKKLIKNFKNISIGINIDKIDYSRYYYNRMRSYFLHIVNSLINTPIEELKENAENVCTKIMLDNNNFKSEYEQITENIKFKKIIDIYLKILKLKYRVENIFYIAKKELNEQEKIMLSEFNSLIKLFNIRNDEEKISYMYDSVCEKMMKEIRKLNYCNFENNNCVTMRYTDGFPNSKENGCCSNTYMDKGKNCRYLNEDYSCKICSISCRVFTCKYLQDRGIDHSLWQYPIIDCSMSKFTRAKLIHNFFIPKEIILKKLRNKLK